MMVSEKFGKVRIILYIYIFQFIILVLVIGGRDDINPQKAIYHCYTSDMYCQLGDYALPTVDGQNPAPPGMVKTV